MTLLARDAVYSYWALVARRRRAAWICCSLVGVRLLFMNAAVSRIPGGVLRTVSSP